MGLDQRSSAAIHVLIFFRTLRKAIADDSQAASAPDTLAACGSGWQVAVPSPLWRLGSLPMASLLPPRKCSAHRSSGGLDIGVPSLSRLTTVPAQPHPRCWIFLPNRMSAPLSS